MKNLNLDSEVILKLSDLGKQNYHLYVHENKDKEDMLLDKLDSDNNLKISLKDILQVFGISNKDLDKQISRDILVVEEQKEFSLNNIIGIKLSNYGKKIYYLHVFYFISSLPETEDVETYKDLMCNRLNKNGLLMISLKELITIFGGYNASQIFTNEGLMVDEKDLNDPINFEETSTRNRA